MGSLGISHKTPVVAYDDSGGMSAGRLVWMLRIVGHDAALLDGGLQAWTGELETHSSVREAVDHPIREWPQELFADADAAELAGQTSGETLVDSRSQIASQVSTNLSTLKQVTSQGQQIFPSLTTWLLMAISNLLMNCANVSKELAAAANNPQ